MKTTAIMILLIVVLGIGALALNKKKTEAPTEGSKSGDAQSKKAEETKNREPLTNIKLGENKTFISATQEQPKAAAVQEYKTIAQIPLIKDAPILIAKQPEVQKPGPPQPIKGKGTSLTRELNARSIEMALYMGLN